ncbi:MAG: hypothetical protein WBF94_12605, partial [Gordonia sp. (in: high G+C Gram-positive bacteria)]
MKDSVRGGVLATVLVVGGGLVACSSEQPDRPEPAAASAVSSAAPSAGVRSSVVARVDPSLNGPLLQAASADDAEAVRGLLAR